MKRLLILALLFPLAACTSPPPPPPELPPVPGEVLVGLEAAGGEVSAYDAVMILSAVHGEVDLERSIPQLGVFLVKPSAPVTDAIRALSVLDGVAFAEPNAVYSVPDPVADALDPPSIMVNDPRVQSQWHHERIFDPHAWDYGSGAGVVIAVADTGVDCSMAEIPCVAGYDATTRRDLAPTTNSDGHGHGSHVSSTAAGAGNNGNAGAGVAWSARVMPVRVLGSNGSGSMDGIAAGIVWAVDHGADVVNLSLGGPGGSQTLRSALQYATARDVQPVCAAGNAGNTAPSYPAAYGECVSVAAVDSRDIRASFSSYGSTIDVAAPGVGICATLRGGGWGCWAGTSMSSPIAAGVVALLMGRGVTAAQARAILESTADTLTGQSGMGRGRVNALAAMQAVPVAPTNAPPTAPVIVTATPPRFETEVVGPTRTPFPGPGQTVTADDPAQPPPPNCRVILVSRADAVAGEFDILTRCVPQP